MEYIQIDPVTWLIFNPNFYTYNDGNQKHVPVIAIANSQKVAQDFIDAGYKGGIEGKTVVPFKPVVKHDKEYSRL